MPYNFSYAIDRLTGAAKRSLVIGSQQGETVYGKCRPIKRSLGEQIHP